jgi:hypothetical protein
MDTPLAWVMLLVIGLQESRFEHRRQMRGPARGLFQFECGGGVQGVLRHPASKQHALSVCAVRGVAPTATAVYGQLEHDDLLAVAFARLLLWTDAARLPMIGDVKGAWDLYIRTWRPGKPHRHTWDALYARAVEAAQFWLDEEPVI